MDLGFETIGNATIVVHDRGPLLVTDPWVTPNAYYGSWGHLHEIPAEQRAGIESAGFVWFSHGHPDHLNGESLPTFREREILLPDHVGGRIHKDLEHEGYSVTVLPTATWFPLSDRTRVLCLPDYNQDAALLIDVGGTLIINANDCACRGWIPFVRNLTRRFDRTYLLQLLGYGDAEMINFFDETGVRIAPPSQLLNQAQTPVGPQVAKFLGIYGATHYIPSSGMHRYQREDSVWANECTTGLDRYQLDYPNASDTLLPAYVRQDLIRDQLTLLDPPKAEESALSPKDFGDDWSEELEAEELELARAYFRSIEHLGTCLDYVNLRVGGRDNVIPITSRSKSGRSYRRGLTFEVPRGSLLNSLRWNVFDDLLIGNFMKTTLHGDWPATGLYPDFTPFVAKYGDNGGARTAAELDAYFREYRRRTGTFEFLRHRLVQGALLWFTGRVPKESALFQQGRRVYKTLRTW